MRVVKAGSRVRGELQVEHEQRQTDARSVEGASCDVVVEALALTAALALDAVVAEEQELRRDAPSAGGASSADPRGAQTAPAEPGGGEARGEPSGAKSGSDDAAERRGAEVGRAEPRPAGSTREVAVGDGDAPDRSAPAYGAKPLGWRLGAQALVQTVVSPRASWGGAVTGRIELGERGPGVGLAVGYTRSDLFSDGEASAAASTFTLSACPGQWSVGRSDVTVVPCAFGAAGWLTVRGDELAEPRAVSRAWWSLGALARGAVRLTGRLRGELELGLARPLAQRRFISMPLQRTVAETPGLALHGALGVSTSF